MKLLTGLAGAVILCNLIAATPVAAAGMPEANLRGFGTLGVAHNTSDGAGFTRDVSQPKGVKDGTSGHIDSRFGLQLDLQVNHSWSATAQVVSRYNYEQKYSPEMAWGFLKYTPNSNVEIRAGRLGWDVYMLADSRDVGYTYLWARPPVEYYGPLQFSKLNGADIVLRRQLGSGLVWGKLFAGEAVGKLAVDRASHADVDGTTLAGGHINYDLSDWQFRLGYTWLELDLEFGGEITRLLAFLDAMGDLPSLMDPGTGQRFQFLSAGITHDRGPLQTQLMYNYVSAEDDLSPDFHSSYISAGYRLGKWTPYATLSYVDTTSSADMPALPPGLPLSAGEIDALVGIRQPSQHTLSAGVRYDIFPTMAVKFQVDRVNVRARGRHFMVWQDVEPDWNGRATVFSATLDFVF